MNDVRSVSFIDMVKNSIIARIFMIGFLILLMLIPFAMVLSLINERESRRNSVVQEINSSWAWGQTVAGPVLKIPYNVFRETTHIVEGKEEKTLRKGVKSAYFLPDSLTVTGEIHPEIRYRGIYKSIVYTADLDIRGEFVFPDFGTWKVAQEDILWDDALLSFGMTDMRGINKNIEIQWNDTNLIPKPGTGNEDVLPRGISTNVAIDAVKKQKNRFAMKLNIRGSKTIDFIPLGRKTVVQLSAKWPSPSFNGAFLPRKREIDKKGFNAQWEVLEYNREFPQQWKKYKWDIYNSRFGLELFDPVDQYQQTTRSAKYSILFISLTFLAFFLLIELLNKKKVHLLQYLLVGFALCMFYLLLISLSEHMSFDTAYLISSICIVGLTAFYTRGVSGRRSLAVFMGLIIGGLYSFLYVMLRLEDYSLLMGSLGLFIILAAIMIFTRKIDWYTFALEKNNGKK
ncbi:MAG: cell envelope integrity protein CreD [bacterium]|nr:cell envelope integrity protein CreD [bacterium]